MTSPATQGVKTPQSSAGGVASGIKVVDLAAETRSLASANAPERTARTLVRLETLRITLMTLKSGTKIKEHKTDHELSLQTVYGHVVVHTGNESFDLPSGGVAVVERGVVHDIEAREDSAILVTVCVSLGQAGWTHGATPEAPSHKA